MESLEKNIGKENLTPKENMPDIEDEEDAQEFIEQAIDRGELPIISIEEKYIEATRNGITPHSTWIEEKIIAGTIARDPYLPDNQKRRLFKIKVPANQIRPRFTGEPGSEHFYGIVAFKGPIPPDALEEITI